MPEDLTDCINSVIMSFFSSEGVLCLLVVVCVVVLSLLTKNNTAACLTLATFGEIVDLYSLPGD